jgi:wyosine [tRNA(Phe)-imidazoG37] synthetase (radical SAM superfamily)
MDVRDVARGIRDFTLGYGGQVWLEVLVVSGANDTMEEARAIVAALEGARVDKVQLNTVARAPAESWAGPVPVERMERLAKVLEGLAPVEIIGGYAAAEHASGRPDVEEAILATLARRPCGAAELAASLGLKAVVVVKHVEAMERSGRLERIEVGGAAQYRVPPR